MCIRDRLTPMEIRELIAIMKNLISEGKSIFLITHKLKEIKEVADRCTIIRRGRHIATVDVLSLIHIFRLVVVDVVPVFTEEGGDVLPRPYT